MARVRARFQPWGDKADKAHFHDLRRGAMDDAFWDEDELVDHRASKGKRKAPRKPRGCPGNDNKAHVYVWQMREVVWRGWSGKVYSYKVNEKICCGCNKVANRKYTN